MIPESKNFKTYFGTGFHMADELPEFYVDACEEVPQMLAADEDGSYGAFRDEFAVHLRDSSFPPLRRSSQWITDEWLRNVWFDAFGPEPAPGDPYPVPREDWGRRRLTDYMLHAVNQTPELSSPGARAWLEARGLTFEDVAAGVEWSATAQSPSFRPAPEGWLERLHDLTERGLRAEQPGER
ncbi:hypothetical protein [Jiangella alkaliphila]|uniref:Uncharacterized protein n=1 Tax=Jiangella alkaliphila TaxID=419479 RepID=A0A1H2J585_9ACTN|nr:hypothetical protein [Jiangella alkaliphila]SDU51208.1 hypothetical protein SAMN04488563_2284 [Jiangella alkaliphila]